MKKTITESVFSASPRVVVEYNLDDDETREPDCSTEDDPAERDDRLFNDILNVIDRALLVNANA